MDTSFRRTSPTRPTTSPSGRSKNLLLVAVASLLVACEPAATTGIPTEPPATSTSVPPPSPSQPAEERAEQLALAREKIDHVVFIVKENRTFDHLFGRFPGADGATEGARCDGTVVPLGRAEDDSPGATHSFAAGIKVINGGRMNCFDLIDGGRAGQTYIQYEESQIPNYWRYAEEFTLGDRFFSSTYGPTFIEHFWIVASQTNRYVQSKAAGGARRQRRAAGRLL